MLLLLLCEVLLYRVCVRVKCLLLPHKSPTSEKRVSEKAMPFIPSIEKESSAPHRALYVGFHDFGFAVYYQSESAPQWNHCEWFERRVEGQTSYGHKIPPFTP
jgi:hypothetical protein